MRVIQPIASVQILRDARTAGCSPRQGSLLGLTMVFCLAATWSGAVAASPADLGALPRFTLVLGGVAVQDRKTGLVWEQSPDGTFDVWSPSIERCKMKAVGSREGWRAPTIDELKSLIDPSKMDPALPEEHPFANIKSAIFWSATSSPTDEVVAWQVSFFTGKAQTDQKSLPRRIWCVLEE